MRRPALPVRVISSASATLIFSVAAHAQQRTPPAPSPFGGGAGGGFVTATSGAGQDSASVFFWCAVLLAAAFLVGVAFWILRKKLMAGEDAPDVGDMNLGFTLADLRQLHAEGQMTDEEFEYAKRKMAARAKAEIEGVEQDASGSDQPVEPPIEDLGDITAIAPEKTSSEPSEGSSTDVPETDPDNDGGIDDDSGADPDKIDEV